MKYKWTNLEINKYLAIFIALTALFSGLIGMVNAADIGTTTDSGNGFQARTDGSPPEHFNETPPPDSYKDPPGGIIYVHITDISGVNASTIRLYVNNYSVFYGLTPIPDGYNVSYFHEVGFEPGIVTCRIVADDIYDNHLDFTWSFTILEIYEIPLREGWTLISLPLTQIDESLGNVLESIDGKWDCIQIYDALGSNHWKTNSTNKPDQLNDLKTLNHKMGIWINITEPNVNLVVYGDVPSSISIPLYAGWNLVGYPTLNETMTVANALWGTGADRIEVFDHLAPYGLREVGPTYIMKPGEAYWVHVLKDSDWVVDW